MQIFHQSYMKKALLIIAIFATILYQRVQGISASTTLSPHPLFRAGTFSIPAAVNDPNLLQSYEVPYTSAFLTLSGLMQPIVGLDSIDFSPQLYTLDFQVQISIIDVDRFSIDLKMDRSKIIQFKFTYLTCIVSDLKHYFVVYFGFTGPYQGPSVVQNNYRTGLLHSSSSKTISFIYSLGLTSGNANSFQLDQKTTFENPDIIKVQINIPTWQKILQVSLCAVLIDDLSFQAGMPTGSVVQSGTLSTTINYLLSGSFTSVFRESLIIGLGRFWYSNGKMVFTSTLNSVSYQLKCQNFNPMDFSYIQVQYMQCPNTARFFKASDGQCYDDCGLKYYDSPSTKTCQQCLYQCEDCLDDKSCSLCDSLDNRQLASNDCVPKPGFFQTGVEKAQPCQPPCANCQINNHTCLSCIDDIYYFDGSTNLCTLCSNQFSNCIRCTTTGCLSCIDDTFYLNPSTNLCTLCSNQFSNCLRCTNTGCLSCVDDTFYLNPSTNLCTLCSNQFTGCNRCTTTSCLSCIDDTFYLNPLNNLCTLCSNIFSDCMQCSTTSCLSCTSDSYYLNSGICTLCGNIFANCDKCSTTGCSSCISNAYYIDAATNLCTSCGTQFSNCNTCTATSCLTCLDNTYYFDGTNNVCTLCSGQFPNCYTCTTTCLSCIDNNYYFDSSNNICTPCGNVFPNCNTCTATCDTCDSGYTLTKTSLCQAIICSSYLSSNGCLACSATDTCYSCDQANGYYFTINNDCSNICGDSILNTNLEQCEDGNTDNMDGCSSSCLIQSGFSCPVSPTTKINECTYLLPINFTINSLYKVPQGNKVKATMTLSPALKIFENYNFQSLVSTDLPVSQYIFTYDKLTGILEMVMAYNETIDGRQCVVTIDPPNLGVFLSTPSSNIMITMNSTDRVPFNFYNQTYYELSSVIFYVSVAISILAWLVVFVGFYNGKIIGIETLGVVQLTFLAMLSFPYALNPCLKSLSGLSFSNGINIFLLLGGATPSLHSQQYLVRILPLNFRQLLWNVPLLQNYNLDTLFIFVPLLVGLAIFIAIKIKERKGPTQQDQNFQLNMRDLEQRFYKFLFQITLVGLILTQYIFFASMGIQAFYGFSNMDLLIDYASIAVLIAILIPYIAYFILLIRENKNFGEFKTFFSLYVNNSSKFYNYIMIQRLLIGLTLSIFCSPFAIVIPITLTIVQFVLVLVKRPYSNNINNYRSLANLIIQFLILTILLGLSLVQFLHPKQQVSTSPIQTSPIFFYAPLIIVLLLFVLILYNFIFLLIHIRSVKGQIDDKMVMQKQIIDLNKERMKAYEMNQFMPSPFLLLREQLDRGKKLYKNIHIPNQQQQTVIGQISPSFEAKGPLLNKEFINQMFQEKIEQNSKKQQGQFKLGLQRVQYMRKMKQQLAKPMNDIQLAQQWQKIDHSLVKKQSSDSAEKMQKQQQSEQRKDSKGKKSNPIKLQKSNPLKSQTPAQEGITVRVNITDYENL